MPNLNWETAIATELGHTQKYKPVFISMLKSQFDDVCGGATVAGWCHRYLGVYMWVLPVCF